jgi:hypothetical protein
MMGKAGKGVSRHWSRQASGVKEARLIREEVSWERVILSF